MLYENDGDMKIAPDDPSRIFDTSEGAANAFKRETENGNMDRAKQLGLTLAQAVIDMPDGAAYFGKGDLEPQEVWAQRPMLFSFVAHDVVTDLAPNSMVARSALKVFADTIRDAKASLYDKINDQAAYTQYMLSKRTEADANRAMGRVFARLCGHEHEDDVERAGHALVISFADYCSRLMEQMKWE